ncbi:hypothetical protein E2C01_087909 [Portunus trituberculatus]|uniref:Uncharacterized protein n=1 Tax=Portunus trituberculatus TaxID=210409 RepID=A0A5B7J4S0_PORTR|nr:hypothetical protein [Portunus trituberculatus]
MICLIHHRGSSALPPYLLSSACYAPSYWFIPAKPCPTAVLHPHTALGGECRGVRMLGQVRQEVARRGRGRTRRCEAVWQRYQGRPIAAITAQSTSLSFTAFIVSVQNGLPQPSLATRSSPLRCLSPFTGLEITVAAAAAAAVAASPSGKNDEINIKL